MTEKQAGFQPIHILVQVALTVGITLLILKWSPPGAFLLKGPAGVPGKAGASCEAKTVRYDPNGGAVVALKCGANVREVTLARGKQGPAGAPGQGCTVSQSRTPGGEISLLFQCGKNKTNLPIGTLLKQYAGSVQQAKVRPRPTPTNTINKPKAQAKKPKARTVQARPAPRRPAIRRAPVAKKQPTVARKPAPQATTSTPTAPSFGPANAKVTILEFSDFQCPFCQRGSQTVTKLKQLYGNKIRVLFKHLPLPFHKEAHLAAQASMAAHAQGKFWKYHDILFANTNQLAKTDLLRYAQQLQLDMKRFKAALDNGTYKAYVDKDLQEAKKLGASGTPTFFINGQKIAGALPLSYFRKVIDAAMKGKKAPAFLPKQPKQPNQPPPGQPNNPQFPVPDFNKVTVGNAPTLGPATAPITIIEFSDFECGFCSRAVGIIKQLKQLYGNKLRVAFKHLPLDFHKRAHLAAQASMAANAQGKFWAFHDRLFQNQQLLDKSGLIQIAKELSLNLQTFQAALDNGTYAAVVNANINEARGLNIRGTPTFFINGYRVAGAFPVSYFQKVIDAVKAGKKPPAFKPPARPGAGQALQVPTKPVAIPLGASPSTGPDNAKVTIVEFSDFECSFCSRGSLIMKRIKKHFGDKVRIVFKHAPIDSHPNAKMAAQASLAAHAQGKFWALHDRLFQHHNSLSQSKIESLAQQAGLDMVRFRREMKAGTYANAVNQDSQLAQKLGATNTPSFFVNGIMLVGARPFFYFKRAVEAALAGKSIAAAVKKHTDKDTRPVKLYLQGAPTAGPTNAKVTVVEFSDFECGFCASAATTMQKLKKKYGNRVRFVFKHLPLKFHKKAKLAAIASMAANEQGKFWEFHDLLFKNQKKLGKPLYLRLARQLKLDMKAFKAALNSKKYDTRIAEDYAEGRWAGADGTPAFFVNGRRMMGVIPFDKLSQTIDAALKAK